MKDWVEVINRLIQALVLITAALRAILEFLDCESADPDELAPRPYAGPDDGLS